MKNEIIKIFPKAEKLFKAAAEDFIQRALAAVAAKNAFTVVLSGGNTAKYFFDALVAGELDKPKIPWQQIKFFFGDERYVPANDADSNYHSAQEHLFAKVAVPAENIYRMPTEFDDPKTAAQHYATTIRQVFNLKNNEFPQFDLVYLGLGEDGHTASLMPGSAVLAEKNNQLVAALWAPQVAMYRITLTPAAINHAANICFLVTGENKALAVSQTLAGAFNPERYPAQLIRGAHENNIWYLDQAAAKNLEHSL